MKWYKHESNARHDVKIQILMQKHGVEGYGLYFLLLEMIAEYASEGNIPEWGFVDKFHTIDTLSKECGVGADKLRTFLEDCNKLDLFQQKDNRLYNKQILKRLDDYAQRLLRNSKKNEAKYEDSSNNVPTVSEQSPSRVEKSRIEQSRKEENINRHINYLLKLPEEDVEEFIKSFNCNASQVTGKGKDLFYYCKAKGKAYKDYKAFLRNALRKDFGDRVQAQVMAPPEELSPEEKIKADRKLAELRAKFKKEDHKI